MAVNGSNFVDYVKIHCAAGHGGAGSAHLHRSRLTAKGGPDGGDGGRGGNVYLRGNDQMWTLLHLKYKRHIKAGRGGNGSYLLALLPLSQDTFFLELLFLL